MRLLFLFLAGLFLAASSVLAIVPGQVSDFEDGTTMGWKHGVTNANSPGNVPEGGPGGVGDGYLKIGASGSFGPGGRLVAYNTALWKGNYKTAEVVAVRADLKNFNATIPLPVRVGVETTGGCHWVTTVPMLIPQDGAWHRVEFDLTTMTRTDGSCAIGDALRNVLIFRIMAATNVMWQGDEIAASLGVDNIVALAESVPVEPSTWGGIKARYP